MYCWLDAAGILRRPGVQRVNNKASNFKKNGRSKLVHLKLVVFYKSPVCSCCSYFSLVVTFVSCAVAFQIHAQIYIYHVLVSIEISKITSFFLSIRYTLSILKIVNISCINTKFHTTFLIYLLHPYIVRYLGSVMI